MFLLHILKMHHMISRDLIANIVLGYYDSFSHELVFGPSFLFIGGSKRTIALSIDARLFRMMGRAAGRFFASSSSVDPA